MDANTANSTVLTTNFDVSPYYDDYDPSRGYYRILFKPGYSVQARELTQMQTGLQEQIARFGKNIFKDGTIVLPGAFYLETNDGLSAGRGIRYVKVKDFDASNNTVSMSQWNGFLNNGKDVGNTRLEVVGATSNIHAKVIQVLDGVQSSTNTKTLYVSYTTGSSVNTSVKAFQAGETLSANVNNTVFTLVVHDTDPAPTGMASRFTIKSGVMWAKNHFIAFPEQSVIINRYDPNPTARVGFYITEDIVTASQDATLLDPAQEASNFTAPGADRLQLNPVLDVVPIDASVNVQDFVTLFTIEGGVVKSYNANTQYSYINDAMARRNYDNTGDYVVAGMEIQLKEHDNTGSNYGRYANGNNSLLWVGVSPGKAYVQGYETTALATVDLSTEKGLTNKAISGQLASTTMGQYVTVNEFVGGWQLNKGKIVNLYDTAQQKISKKKWSDGALTGSIIGTAVVLAYEYASGIPGYNATYNVYLADIQMSGTNSFTSVRSLSAAGSGTSSAMCADVVLDLRGNAVLQNVPNSTLLYFTGSRNTKTIRNAADPTSSETSFQFYDTQGISSSVQVSTNGVFSLALSPGVESFPYGTTSLSASQLDGIHLTFNQTSGGANVMYVGISGTAAAGAGTNSLVGSGTKFSRLNVGDKFQLSGNNLSYQVTSITDDTHLTVDVALPAVALGNTLSKVYRNGDMIDLSSIGVANGVSRSVSATPTTLQFDLKETYPSVFYVTVSYPVERSTALEIKKTLKAGRYVKIDCSSAGVTGPFDLGLSDIYKVKSIRINSGSFPTSNTSGTDVTNSFTVNNGQKDTHYDHGYLKPKMSLDSSSRLLVELDYFVPDFTNRGGFFSVDSYPVQDDDTLFNPVTDIRTENIPVFKSPTTGQVYDLRNQLDFRPVKNNTASDTTDPSTASVNPGASSTFLYPATGMKFPVPSSQITYDYYYYLGRWDIVAVDKDNRFQVIKGVPSTNPQIPDVPPGVMALAKILIVPYPSLAPSYASLIDRQDISCAATSLSNLRFTMQDIAKLKQRIVNLEYYTSLTVLEKAASSLIIPNDSGVDRFKNGIFTDNFRDNSLGAINDPEFRIVYDTQEKTIRPVYKMESVTYDFLRGTNVKHNNPIITVDYDEVLHYEQQYATTDINVERQSWLFLGTVDLFPAQDIWVDTTIMPDEKLSNKSIYVVNYGTQGTSNEAITAYGTTAHIFLSGNSAYGTYTSNGYFNANTTGGVIDVLNNTEWNSWKTDIVGYKVYTGQVTSDGNPVSTTFTTYDDARSYAQSINSAGGAGVTVETVYNTSRTGTQYWEADSADVVQTDYKVVDVQSYSYIRPQTITVHCTGMKPHTQMWPYFDNIAMANNARPLTANQFSWIITNGQYGLAANTLIDLQTGTSTNPSAGLVALPSSLGPWAGFGDDLVTDANGRLDFQLQITSGQFRVGQRNCLVIDSRQFVDVSSTTSAATVPPDVSTGGQAVFTASGQAITKQRSILSTKTASFHTETVSQNYNSAGFEYIAAPPPPCPCSHSCSAYSFKATAQNGEEGMFITGVDLFISRIGQEGFWVEIREMDSGQQITRNTVPYSEVFFNDATTVPISPDGNSNPCRVTFQAPVFLYNNTQYALVIHPINANPDLYVWISRLGQMDVKGLGMVHDRRGLGTFYQTNNNTNWDIIPDVDLRVKFYRAQFKNNIVSNAYLKNRPIEKLFVYNGSIDFTTNQGQIFISGDHFTLSGANCTPAIGDFAVGDRSEQNSAMVNVSTALAASNTGYYKGEVVHFYSSDGSYKGDATISDITNASGRLDYYQDGTTSTVQLSGSGGGFVVGDSVICSTDWSQYGVISTIWGISNFRYSAFSFEPSYLKFQLTDISFQMRPSDTTGAVGSYVDIDPSTTQYFNTEKAVLSRTNELTQISDTDKYSNMILVNMSTASNVVSPVVDTTKTQTIILDNIINNDTTNETLPSHGALLNKYISKVVTLDEGQDAEDMMVVITAYRPPGTDVKVWLKILNSTDPNSIGDQHWVELYKYGNGDQLYSSIDDRNNFKEFTYLVPKVAYDRLTLTSPSTTVAVGHILVGQTSGFSASVTSIESDTIYIMSGSGFAAGETVNIVSGTTTIGTAVASATGRTVALNGTSGGTSNVISYTTDSGVTYTTYKYFAIKIGLLNDGTNSAVVPRVGDLRALALQL
jgi:Domain of unknown function (DUF4815)